MNPSASSRRKTGLCIAYGTAPSRLLADRIAREAVDSGVAACAHRLPRIRSVYRWKGRVESSWEYPLLFKLRADRLGRLTALFVRSHPYECPGLASWPIEGGYAPFLDWIRNPCSDALDVNAYAR